MCQWPYLILVSIENVTYVYLGHILRVESNLNTVFGKTQMTCFFCISTALLILNKNFHSETRKTKSCVSSCMPRWVSEWNIGVGQSERGGLHRLLAPHSNRGGSTEWKKDLTASVFFLNKLLYLNWVPEEVYNFHKVVFEQEIAPLVFTSGALMFTLFT